MFKEGERIVLRDRTTSGMKSGKRGTVQHIRCIESSHLGGTNPLRISGRTVESERESWSRRSFPQGIHLHHSELAEWQFDTEHAHVTVEDPSAGAITRRCIGRRKNGYHHQVSQPNHHYRKQDLCWRSIQTVGPLCELCQTVQKLDDYLPDSLQTGGFGGILYRRQGRKGALCPQWVTTTTSGDGYTDVSR